MPQSFFRWLMPFLGYNERHRVDEMGNSDSSSTPFDWEQSLGRRGVKGLKRRRTYVISPLPLGSFERGYGQPVSAEKGLSYSPTTLLSNKSATASVIITTVLAVQFCACALFLHTCDRTKRVVGRVQLRRPRTDCKSGELPSINQLSR